MKQQNNIEYRDLTNKDMQDLESLFKGDYLPIKLQEIIEGGFAIETKIEKHSLLFLSMNPSFSNNSWNNGTDWGENAYYERPNSDAPQDSTNPFFKAINKFYDDLEIYPSIPLAHHDLLFIRKTDQKMVLKWKKELEKCNPDFFSKQLNLSKTIIEESEPQLIVVLNASARELFKELFNDDCNPSFCDKLGANIYTINGNKTPVLFSGMLSGRRALDLGSQESLKWHIKYILNKLNKL